MKTLIPFIIVFIFTAFSFNLNAQQIDSIVVTPKGLVAPMDTVKIYIYNTFNSGGCTGSALYGKSGFKINASSLHCLGPLTFICHDVDTVILKPPHNLGTYTFSYVLNSGFGTPCSPGIVPDDSDTAYFTVSSFPPADLPPVISSISNDTICENDSTSYIVFTITDEDIFSCVVTARSDNQLLVPDSNVTVNPGGFSYFVNAIPAKNQSGLANITVTVTDSVNQKDSTSYSLLVEDCAVGVKENVHPEISIFPNPNSGEFVVQLDRSYNNAKVSLVNSLGVEVYREKSRNQTQLRLSQDLNPGIYYLILTVDGLQEVKKVVVE